MAYIYYIKNTLNQKMYIGETLYFHDRIQRHLNDLRKNEHHSSKLQNAFNKYGEENFIYGILEEVSEEERFNKEIEYIKKYQTYELGYNETKGGDNPGYNKLQKRVYCYDYEGNFLNISYCSGREASRQLGIDQALLQKICCNKRKSATSNNGMIMRFSYEKLKKLPPIQEYDHNAKKIAQYDEQHNLIQIFNSGADVNRYFNNVSKNSKIYTAIKENKKYKGFYWEYL